MGTWCAPERRFGRATPMQPVHVRFNGTWEDVTPSENVHVHWPHGYMGIVKVSRLRHWNVVNIYSGLLPPRIMPRRHFTAFLAMLQHVAGLDNVSQQSRGKLRFVWWLLQHVYVVSAKLFQLPSFQRRAHSTASQSWQCQASSHSCTAFSWTSAPRDAKSAET